MCDEMTTCSICRAYELRDDLILFENDPEMFELGLSLYRPHLEDRERLRAERERMIEAGELVIVHVTCERCGQGFYPRRGRDQRRWCHSCVSARWWLDEDGVMTRAYGGTLPESAAREVGARREREEQGRG